MLTGSHELIALLPFEAPRQPRDGKIEGTGLDDRLFVEANKREVIARELERNPPLLTGLQVDFREALVLRELEGLSYKEISEVIGVPMGTVMSRLARARHKLYLILSERKEHGHL